MKPTSDDAAPRADGWFEHRGTWGEVVLGTVLADHERRSKRWEIVDVAMHAPVRYGDTLWMRAREQVSGEEVTIAPRVKVHPVTILTQDPADTATAEPTPPSDAEATLLLIQELGAEVLAHHDTVTGEVVCPDYIHRGHGDQPHRNIRDGLVEHLRVAHGIKAGDGDYLAISKIHDAEHHPRTQGSGGFPHRHVPEDLTIFTGI